MHRLILPVLLGALSLAPAAYANELGAPGAAAMQQEKAHVAELIAAAHYPQAESVAAAKAQTPNAEARYALQLSSPGADRRGMVLHVAEHILGQYPKGKVDIEIVAFGPGISLLLADNNPLMPLIAKLAKEGVRFSACGNALTHTTMALGRAPTLVPAARVVPAGIVRVHDLAVAGYFLDKP
ncbi:hypothetical protein [Halothiobacillus sp. DCM-1]|uniref:DsrE family protein n=1 Tax=Halothiobacillus sp. DCM-1 TaxID=3112558 RepID=UPI00324AB677